MNHNEGLLTCPRCRQQVDSKELLVGSLCTECMDDKELKRREKLLSFRQPPFAKEKPSKERNK
jgi:reverse gyrase